MSNLLLSSFLLIFLIFAQNLLAVEIVQLDEEGIGNNVGTKEEEEKSGEKSGHEQNGPAKNGQKHAIIIKTYDDDGQEGRRKMANPKKDLMTGKVTEFNLDEAYTKLLLLFPKRLGSSSMDGDGGKMDTAKLRKLQFRLIAWNLAEERGNLAEMRKVLDASEDDDNIIKFACELWKDGDEKALRLELTKATNDPKYAQHLLKMYKNMQKENSEATIEERDAMVNCAELEAHLKKKEADSSAADLDDGTPKWVNEFMAKANMLHLEQLKKLLANNGKEGKGKKKDDDLGEEQFERQSHWWWTNLKEAPNQEQQNSVGEEGGEIDVDNKKGKEPPIEEEQNDGGNLFVREMRKLALNSLLSADGEIELMQTKRHIVSIMDEIVLLTLEELHPFLFNIGHMDLKATELLYSGLFEHHLDEAISIKYESRLAIAILFGEIWKSLAQKVVANNRKALKWGDLDQLEEEWAKFFKIVARFPRYADFNKLTRIEAQEVPAELWAEFWHDRAAAVAKNGNKFVAVRNGLLWTKHWGWLNRLKDAKFLDPIWRPGASARLAQLFGGFDAIWAKVEAKEATWKEINSLENVEIDNFDARNLAEHLLAPFRINISDIRAMQFIDDYFVQLFDLELEAVSKSIRMLKKMPNKKAIPRALDVLIWMGQLDGHFDGMGQNDGDEQPMVNQWWNCRIEVELFHDSLTNIDGGGFEELEKPALTMLNWMHLLRHKKCSNGDDNEEMLMENNLAAYIGRCKKKAAEFTQKEKRLFDEEEMRNLRADHIRHLLAEGGRHYSPVFSLIFDAKLNHQKNNDLDKNLEKFLGQTHSENVKKIAKEAKYSEEKILKGYIQILATDDEAARLQAEHDLVYNLAVHRLESTKLLSHGDQTLPSERVRQLANKVYDTATMLENKALDEMERTSSGVQIQDDEHQAVGLPQQPDGKVPMVNQIQVIKMVNDLEIAHTQRNTNFLEYDRIRIISVEETLANMPSLIEEHRNLLNTWSFEKFVRYVRNSEELQGVLRDTLSSNYRLDRLLGYNLAKGKQNIEAIWEELKRGKEELMKEEEEHEKLEDGKGKKKAKIEEGNAKGNKKEKMKRGEEKDMEEGMEEMKEEGKRRQKGGRKFIWDFDLIRDPNFFSYDRLLRHYTEAIGAKKAAQHDFLTRLHIWAANLIVWMQHFELAIMRAESPSQSVTIIRQKFGELIRLLGRIEYDKIWTQITAKRAIHDFDHKVHSSLFTDLTYPIAHPKHWADIPPIVGHYRTRGRDDKRRNRGDQSKKYADLLRKMHLDGFEIILEKQKAGEGEDKNEHAQQEGIWRARKPAGKGEEERDNNKKNRQKEEGSSTANKVDGGSLKKILQDANSSDEKRAILLELIGSVDQIATLFKKIDMKIRKENYRDQFHDAMSHFEEDDQDEYFSAIGKEDEHGVEETMDFVGTELAMAHLGKEGESSFDGMAIDSGQNVASSSNIKKREKKRHRKQAKREREQQQEMIALQEARRVEEQRKSTQMKLTKFVRQIFEEADIAQKLAANGTPEALRAEFVRLAMDGDERHPALLAQFERDYLQPYTQMLEQNKLDQTLFSEYQEKKFLSSPVETSKNFLSMDFNKIVEHARRMSDDRQIREQRELTRLVAHKIGYAESEEEEGNSGRMEKIEQAISGVRNIVEKIWAPATTMQIGGPYQLGIVTEQSHIDAIVIASERTKQQRFFGGTFAKCISMSRRCDDKESLYCKLCQDRHIFNLVRNTRIHIPLLKFIYCTHFRHYQMEMDSSKLPIDFQCVPFELAYVSVRGYETISMRDLEKTQMLIEHFRLDQADIYQIDWSDPRAGMIHALSGYQLNKDILGKLVTSNRRRVFRICLMALTKWAQNNHIFSGPYGFLNVPSLSLMLLKISLRYPIGQTVPFILEQFFLHFDNWPWPLPVQFAALGADKTHTVERKLGWRPERERNQKSGMFTAKVPQKGGWGPLPTLNMPIIAPGAPERNLAYNVNHSTQHLILEEIRNAATKMRGDAPHHRVEENGKNLHDHHHHQQHELWTLLLATKKDFSKQYSHYIVLYCFATSLEQSEEFCGEYVRHQLRLQLAFSVERTAGIERCHVWQNEEQQKARQPRLMPDSVRHMLEGKGEGARTSSWFRYWTIGVKFRNDGTGAHPNEQQINAQLNGWQDGFVTRFMQDYSIISMRHRATNSLTKAEIDEKIAALHLHAQIIGADQLSNWDAKRSLAGEGESVTTWGGGDGPKMRNIGTMDLLEN